MPEEPKELMDKNGGCLSANCLTEAFDGLEEDMVSDFQEKFDAIADSDLTFESDMLGISSYKHYIILDEVMDICMQFVDAIKKAQED